MLAGPGEAYSQYVSCRIMNSARSSAVIVAPQATSASVSKNDSLIASHRADLSGLAAVPVGRIGHGGSGLPLVDERAGI